MLRGINFRKSCFALVLIVFFMSLISINSFESKSLCGDGSTFNHPGTFSGSTYCCQSENGSISSCENCDQFSNESCLGNYRNESLDFISNCIACKEPSEHFNKTNSCLNTSDSSPSSLKKFNLDPVSYGIEIGQGGSLKNNGLKVSLLGTSSDGAKFKFRDGQEIMLSEGEVLSNAVNNGNPALVASVDNSPFVSGNVELKEIGSSCGGNSVKLGLDQKLEFVNSSSSLSINEINFSSNDSKHGNSIFEVYSDNGQRKSVNSTVGQKVFQSSFAQASLMNVEQNYVNLCICGKREFNVGEVSTPFLGIDGLFVFDN